MAQHIIRHKLPCRAILSPHSISRSGQSPSSNMATSAITSVQSSGIGVHPAHVSFRGTRGKGYTTGKGNGNVVRTLQRSSPSSATIYPASRAAGLRVYATGSLELPNAVSTARVPRRQEFEDRSRVKDIKGGEDGGLSNVGKTVCVRAWVRTVRSQKTFAFLELNDGSSLSGLQVVVQTDCEGYDLVDSGAISTGAAVCISGEVVESVGGNQKVEIAASKVELVGSCDSSTYPLQKKRHSLEFLRGIAHLRPRTNLIGAVARVRSALAYATHSFFQERQFVYVHSPIITASDCEGAGEQFLVTTLMSGEKGPEIQNTGAGSGATAADIAHLEAQVAEQADKVRALKKEKADGVKEAVAELMARKAAVEAAHSPSAESGNVNFDDDFFAKPAYLTVSGQLNAETYACALKDVYTFGPTFRAENSNTSRHLAEFWMIEPELAFADLEDDMACAEAYLKHCVRHVLEHCAEDLAFFEKFTEKGLTSRLQDVVDKEFGTITYTAAVDELMKVQSTGKKKFEYDVFWGKDLQSEHERYLSEKVFNGTPLIVTDYPKEIKAFYMRENDDGRTVAAMDLLVPNVGELIGGSQREERMDVLQRRLAEVGLEEDPYWWYMDLRRYGSVPHAGFGLGFERLVQFCTGVENIRDVIPFPRYPGNANF